MSQHGLHLKLASGQTDELLFLREDGTIVKVLLFVFDHFSLVRLIKVRRAYRPKFSVLLIQ